MKKVTLLFEDGVILTVDYKELLEDCKSICKDANYFNIKIAIDEFIKNNNCKILRR